MDKIFVSITCKGEWTYNGEYHTYVGDRVTKGFRVKKESTYDDLRNEINRRMRLVSNIGDMELYYRWGGDGNRGIAPCSIEDDDELAECFGIYEGTGCVPLYVTVRVPSADVGEGSSGVFPADVGEGSSRPAKMAPRRSQAHDLVDSSYPIVSLGQNDTGPPEEASLERNWDIVVADDNLVDHTSTGHVDPINSPYNSDDEYVNAFADDGDEGIDLNADDDDAMPDVANEAGPQWYEPHQVPEGVTPSNRRLDETGMSVEDIFSSVVDFDMKLKDTCLRTGDVMRSKRKDPTERDWRCKDPACKWRARAVRVSGTSMFRLQQYNPYHTCSIRNKNVDHDQCNSQYIAESMLPQFYDIIRAPSVKGVKNFCKDTLKQEISNWKALDAHRKAMAMVGGDPYKNYGDIPSYLYMVRQKNEGTVVHLETDDENQFKYCFIALGASIKGFEFIRPVIMIDAAFLKSKFKGQLVVAAASCAEHHIYVLAYGIIDVECNASWVWFLERLRDVYGDREGMLFVSDRHHAIAHAINELYVNAKHANCYYHLKGNLTSMFPRGNWTSLFYGAAYTCDPVEFNRLFTAMEDSCTTVHVKSGKTICQHLRETVEFKRWARSHCPERRYEIMTSNHAESFNSAMKRAREAPPITLLDEVLNTVSAWFATHRETGQSFNSELVPRIDKKLVKKFRNAKYVTCTSIGPDTFSCKSQLFKDHTVDLREDVKSCTCGKFQIKEIPCVHACAALRSGKKCIKYTSWFYTSKAFRKAYEEFVYPVPNRTQWSGQGIPDVIRDRVCLPPPYIMKRGRQQRIRHPSQGETVMNIKRKYRCKNCKEGHHSKKYCPKLQMQHWFD